MMADIRRLPDGLHRRRTHPHMETHHHKLSIAYVFPISINGASPVETQNLASPVPPMPIYSCNKPLTIIAYSPCETQNLASPVLPIPIHSCNIPLTITAHTPCETQDFASLLLQAANIILKSRFTHSTASVMCHNGIKTACQQTQLSRFSTALSSSHDNV